MKGQKTRLLPAAVSSVFFILWLLLIQSSSARPSEEASERYWHDLTPQDCIKCHIKEKQDIETHGGAHKDKVKCTDCHDRHPPKNWRIVPECGMCHVGTAHFKSANCLECHSNPHMPMKLTIARNITEPCISCHEEPAAKLGRYFSFHSILNCTDCHHFHGYVPKCIMCHTGHSAGGAKEECGTCHDAHKPLVVEYGDEEFSTSCKACHEDEAEKLGKSVFMHHELECTGCHEKHHGMVPQCRDCHESPHKSAMLPTLSECGKCHNTAHDLHKNHIKESTKDACGTCHDSGESMEVTYSEETPSDICISCHAKAARLILTSGTRHARLECATCHENKHGAIPQCRNCHESPHSEKMLAKFPCTKCHNRAHDLYR